MRWLALVGLGWLALSGGVAVVLGRAIRLADEAEQPDLGLDDDDTWPLPPLLRLVP